MMVRFGSFCEYDRVWAAAYFSGVFERRVEQRN